MPQHLDNLVEEFAQALVDCRQIYLTAARQCIRDDSAGGGKSPRERIRAMDELHQGLLIKVYMTVAASDRQWQPAEQRLAQVLIEHAFNRSLRGAALREATKGLRDRSIQLSLRSVVEPFLRYPTLRDHLAELATVVLRVANLVAKADGTLTPNESRELHQLDRQFSELLGEATSVPSAAAPRSTPEATRQAAGRSGTTSVKPPHLPPELPQEKESGDRQQSAAEWSTSAHDEAATPQVSLQDALAQLDALIGLQSVKSEVHTLTNFLKIQQQRAQAGLPETPISLHLVFQGNPGTGKTTVARIIGQIYGAMGILDRGHLVETDRSGLVAEYAGQTGPKTNTKIDEAVGGVLFIDEAYSLVAEEGDDPYGREAMQTILKRMEDDREQLAVVLAGYPEPMDRLLRSNPGLSSRFGRVLRFPDFSGPELATIFGNLCRQNRYELSSAVRHRLLVAFHWLYAHRDEHFGNGRLVRNVFEDAIRRLSNRIVDVTPLTHELLTCFHVEDLPFQRVATSVWDNYPAESTRYRVSCAGCERSCRMPAKHLGRQVRCRHCQCRFVVEWPELLNEGNKKDPE